MTLPSSGPLAMTDIQTEFGGSNPIGLNEYYAGGGLVPAGASGTYGAVPTSGQISVQNFYGTANYIPVYIEDLFSTYLYTGNGSTQTITNGIDLAGKGGLVWRKQRTANWWTAWTHHSLSDTARGVNAALSTSRSTGQDIGGDSFVTAFNASGFSIGPDTSGYGTNKSAENYVAWTFREAPKFFDIVTFSQASGSTTTFNHDLGATPGCMLIKTTDVNNFWLVYHTALGNNQYIILGNTAGAQSYSGGFSVSSTSVTINNALLAATGNAFVAYLFAHNAGGFGLTGTDNVISCGSFSGNTTVDLGYEPQWVLLKNATSADNWYLIDNMRGWPVQGNGSANTLYANSSVPEQTGDTKGTPTATGFTTYGFGGSTGIYIAIRRGPMKVPTDGTKVFTTVTRTGNSTETKITSVGFPPDALFSMNRNNGGAFYNSFYDRLRGPKKRLSSNSTNAEYPEGETAPALLSFDQVGYTVGTDDYAHINSSGTTYVNWLLRRAPGFFDVVCYPEGSFSLTVPHNLTVVPELCIAKARTSSSEWKVYVFAGGSNHYGYLNRDYGLGDLTYNPNTSTHFAAGDLGAVLSWSGHVAYLFASCPGVSKVGKYTGTGAAQTINCGFAAGARFVLIKRIDAAGEWYVWDTARGIISGNDPYLLLNFTAGEVTGTDYLLPQSVGFGLTASAPAALNASGGTYTFFAIA